MGQVGHIKTEYYKYTGKLREKEGNRDKPGNCPLRFRNDTDSSFGSKKF
jgi:hypothetical protein